MRIINKLCKRIQNVKSIPFNGFGIGTVLQGGPSGSDKSIGSMTLLGAEGAETVPSSSLSETELKGR